MDICAAVDLFTILHCISTVAEPTPHKQAGFFWVDVYIDSMFLHLLHCGGSPVTCPVRLVLQEIQILTEIIAF